MTSVRTPVIGGLQQAALPRRAVAGLAAAVVAVTALLFSVTDLQGTAGFVVVATLLHLAAQTVLSRVVEGPRRAADRLVTTAVVAAFLLALAPLVSVLLYTLQNGLERFDWDFFYRSLRSIGARDAGGGANHAIVGTLQQVGLATLMSVPLGLLVAVYVVEYGRGRLAATIRFFVDVMTGIPSIVAGLFVLSFWILGLGFGYSGFAAALALTVLMLPVIVRSAEEMLKLVPNDLREASLALGVPRWKTVVRIVLPTALPGIVTGVMLAVARVMGETAPVLLTAFGAASIVRTPFDGPQSSLPLFIYQEAASPQQTAIDRAWTAALTLILVIMVLNLLARLITRRSKIGR
ncbi:MAG: phosphate transporter, inner rane subunit PstA [Frankiales bacterium]|nr:phosphate transporter, inner rane subunit PstA [Frankiales bacterium]